MKKTLIASAVAAAALSTSAFAMDQATEIAQRLDSMPTFYGNIQVAIDYTDSELSGSNYAFVDNGSTLGVKHKHEVAPGLTAFMKAEFEFDADGDKTGLDQFDEAYIGVEGDFGKVWAGSDDGVYETAIDVTDIFEYVGGNGELDSGVSEHNSVFYQTPSFSGLTLSAQISVNGQSGSTSPKTRDALALAATYSMDALTVGLAYADNEGDAKGKHSIGLSTTYKIDDSLSVQAKYETQKDTVDVFGLSGIYTMGQNQFAAAYYYSEEDAKSGTDTDTIALQALHNVSDNMYVYTEFQWSDAANQLASKSGEAKTLVMGATYNF